MKSKSKKLIELPVYEISLKFNNNLFQAYLFEIFEKLNINLSPKSIIHESIEINNLVTVNFKGRRSIIIFFDKLSTVSFNHQTFFEDIEKYINMTSNSEITIIFYEINEEIFPQKNELIFFLTTEVGIKIFDCGTSNELLEFIQNYTDSIISKEEKSKITFFESKPVSTTNLCDIEGITDESTLIWIKHLMCIPGISENKAINISKIYPNFLSLMEHYNKPGYNDREKENFLKDIEVANKSKNKVTKLGAALSSKIYKVFNSCDSNIIIN